MSKLNYHGIKQLPEECPLCFLPFLLVRVNIRTAYLVCDPCKIAVKTSDPAIYIWETLEKIQCINEQCRHFPMRVFARSDGYIKWFCPKCRTTAETKDVAE